MPPRRVVHGLDAARVTMILAVLERRTPARLGSSDVYVSTVGGLRVNDPAADLAVALAAAGAASDRVVRPGLVAIGELGLAGDVRPVASLRRRLAEAARLGYTEALVPASSDQPTTTELRVSTVDTIDAALGVLD
jgi:DNA repair protein RadA/Sms